nr:MAG TPA: hypothetical protein [Caudoviricetes sp.]
MIRFSFCLALSQYLCDQQKRETPTHCAAKSPLLPRRILQRNHTGDCNQGI